MRPSLPLSLALVLLVACSGDDVDDGQGSASTTDEPSTTDTSGGATGSLTTGLTQGTTETGDSTTQGEESESTEAGESTESGETGSGPTSCGEAECDPSSEYCFESIIDAPSEFSCRTIPAQCEDDVTCACIIAVDCPESLQNCSENDGFVILECVEG